MRIDRSDRTDVSALEGFSHPHSTTFAHSLARGGPAQRKYRELAAAGIATLLGGFRDPVRYVRLELR